MTDNDLLKRFVEERDQEAFTELVRRHVDVVYAAARRQSAGDLHLAEDITQRVFILLSQKAAKLSSGVLLGGWLYNSVRFVARSERRSVRRRKRAEARAAAVAEEIRKASVPANSAGWQDAEAYLDDAMAKLDQESRGVLVLRYFEGKSSREVGDRLGISEEAARKRTSRAVEQLRQLFARRGLTFSSTQVAEGLAVATICAPAHLAASSASAAVSSLAVAKTGTALMAFKGKLVIASLVGVIGLTGIVVAAVAIANHRSSPTFLPNASGTTPPLLSARSARPPSRVPGVVYETNFSNGAGPEWSMRPISITRDKKHSFLGPFREKELQFSLDRLPPHEFIRLTFELITSDRWNGDGANFGRDLWDMRVVGGQPLIHTTFSNCGMFTNNNEQSFPDQYPWYPTHVAWTGASAKQSLGYTTPNDEGGYSGCDSTYAFDIVFPHVAETLTLAFKSELRKHANKPYGFLNFKVSTVDHPAPADDTVLAQMWNDLSGTDPIKAYHAVWSLIASGDAATIYIQDHLPPATNGTSPPINIDQNAIWYYGSFAYDTPAARQRARAIHVLEVIHSPAALAVLAQIGFRGTPVGAPPDPWTQPAKPATKQPSI